MPSCHYGMPPLYKSHLPSAEFKVRIKEFHHQSGAASKAFQNRETFPLQGGGCCRCKIKSYILLQNLTGLYQRFNIHISIIILAELRFVEDEWKILVFRSGAM